MPEITARTKPLLATAAVAALLLPGCAPAESPATTPPAPPSTSSQAPAPSPSVTETETSPAPEETETDDDTPATEAPAGPLDAVGAIEAALAHAPGAVVEVDAEPRRWEVTVLRENGTGVELYIDAASGEVTRERDARLSRVQSTAPKVTAAEAIGIALGNTPGQIIELDLDTERGAVVWEVLVRADAGGRFEIYVDATTGEVLKVERDT